MRIRYKLRIGFGVSALVIALVGGFGVYETHTISTASNEAINVGMKLVEHSQRMRANINMMRRYEKDLFLNLGDGESIDKYEKSWEEARAHAKQRMEQMGKLVDEPKHKETLATINRNLDAYAIGFASVVARIRSKVITTPAEANRAVAEFKAPTHKAEADIAAYAAKNDEETARGMTELNAGTRRSQILLAMFSLIAFLGMGGFALILVHTIRGPLEDIEALVVDMGQGEGDLSRRLSYRGNDELGAICGGVNQFVEKLNHTIAQVAQTAEQVASAAHELSATAEQINQTTTELSNSAERQRVAMTQSSSALEQMSASIRQVRTAAQEAEGVAEGSLNMTAQGSAAAEESNQAMDGIKESSSKVNRITSVIADIARQTNLLSLNAASNVMPLSLGMVITLASPITFLNAPIS